MNFGLIGLGSRSICYTNGFLNASCTKNHKLAALCEIDPIRLNAYAKHFFPENTPALYTDYRDLLADKSIEAVIITVPDYAHKDIAIAAMDAGKHVLLEKPMDVNVENISAIYERASSFSGTFVQGFVLRYAPLYVKIKEIIDSGKLGKLVSVYATEKLGHMHAANFARRWHRHYKNSGGFLNTKCCHDIDILHHLIGSDAESVVSFGSRRFFVPDPTAAQHCKDCSRKDSCIYSFDYTDYGSPERFDCLKDLCVYNSDNELIDDQMVMIRYESGVTAQFELCTYSGMATRTMNVNGTAATLLADLSTGVITITPLATGVTETVSTGNLGGHGGGDYVLLENFINSIENDLKQNDARGGYLASLTCFAADRSMRENRIVRMDEMSK